MIKKYKKIGALLLGLSCLTGGFFTPVEDCLCVSIQAAEQTDKLVCNMTTKELFNEVYGYLRERGYIITFAMPPQSTDDYGLITMRDVNVTMKNSDDTAWAMGRRFFNFYIDKGSSRDFSILNIDYYFGDYNFTHDYIRYDTEGIFSGREAYAPVAANMKPLADNLVNACDKYAKEYVQDLYKSLSVRVKKSSSSAPSRSKER